VDALCKETEYNQRAAVAEALAVVALPCLEAVLRTVLERAPEHFTALAWKLAPEKQPPPAPLREALNSADERVRWGAACALARVSIGEALPHLMDALRRAPTPLLQPVVVALGGRSRRRPKPCHSCASCSAGLSCCLPISLPASCWR